ncbi:MAG: hypothetical protein K6F73_09140 [Lachnospiraceae bacterium]|nr:hypothetical protein [Lachnospiraceae bacterium]
MDHKKNVRSLKADGSFTIEAALIMPIILGIIVLFIYIAMHSYDLCVIEYVCEKTCIDAVREVFSDETEAEDRASSELESRLIGKWDADIRVHSDDMAVYTEIEARSLLFSGAWTYTSLAYKHFLPNY